MEKMIGLSSLASLEGSSLGHRAVSSAGNSRYSEHKTPQRKGGSGLLSLDCCTSEHRGLCDEIFGLAVVV